MACIRSARLRPDHSRRAIVRAHEGRRRHRIRSQQGRRRSAKDAEEAGLRRRLDGRDQSTTRSSRCCSPREHTETLELGTAIAVAFARNPMTLANIGVRPAGVLEGPVHPRPRQPDQAAHHQALLDAVVATRRARMREMVLAIRAIWDMLERTAPSSTSAATSTRHTLMTPFFNPGPEPARRAEDLPRRRRRADDRGRRRGVRRLPLPRLHHRALPPRGHAARARARAGPRPARRWRASRSRARRSSSPAPTRRSWTTAAAGHAPADRVLRLDARLPAACSSSTAGAACRTSSTRCRSRASGWRWATLIDDEILNTFAVVGEPEQHRARAAPPLRRRRPPDLASTRRTRPIPSAGGACSRRSRPLDRSTQSCPDISDAD